MPNSISAVGTAVVSSFTAPLPAFNVNPTAVGNMIGLGILLIGSSGATGVSGGNCTWTRINTSPPNTGGLGTVCDLWLGVATSTGSAALTVTGGSSGGDLQYQQFAGGGAGTVWSVDGTQQGTTNLNTSSTSLAFPTLVPGGASRLYFGFAGTASASSGVTSGYTLQDLSATNAVDIIYNVSVSTSQSPVVTQGSSPYQTCGALIIAASPSAAATPVQVVSQYNSFF
jgi:hypothetical protein